MKRFNYGVVFTLILCVSCNSNEDHLSQALLNTSSLDDGEVHMSLYKKALFRDDTIQLDVVIQFVKTGDSPNFYLSTSAGGQRAMVGNQSINITAKGKCFFSENPGDIVEELRLYRPMFDDGLHDLLLDSSNNIVRGQQPSGFKSYKIELPDKGEATNIIANVLVDPTELLVHSLDFSIDIMGGNQFHKWELVSWATGSYDEAIQHAFDQIHSDCVVIYNTDEGLEQPSSPPFRLGDSFIDAVAKRGETELVFGQVNSQFILLDFWFVSCYPCLKSHPVLDSLDRTFDENLLQIVGVNQVDDETRLSKFEASRDFRHPNFSLLTDGVTDLGEGIHGYPLFLLLDAHRRVVWIQDGYSDDLLDHVSMFIRQ